MSKKKPTRRGRQLGASNAELAKARAAAKRQGKQGGRPKKPASEKIKPGADNTDAELFAAVADHAEYGAEPEDIAIQLGIDKRLNVDEAFRDAFDRTVRLSQARRNSRLARKIIKDAEDGKVTAQKEAVAAYVPAFMDEAPMRDFAAGTPDKILALIEKVKKRRREGKGPPHA